MSGWIGVDLDGTLAHYGGWKGPDHIGLPIAPMVERVKNWVVAGQEVRIFTARVAETGLKNDVGGVDDHTFAQKQVTSIQAWCEKHLGFTLPVTATKDFGMICLYDDRCVQVEINTGRLIGEATA